MEQSELFRIISICCFALGSLLLVVSIVLFFALDIPRVLREMNGKTVKTTRATTATGNEKKHHKAKTTAALKQQPATVVDSKKNIDQAPDTVPLNQLPSAHYVQDQDSQRTLFTEPEHSTSPIPETVVLTQPSLTTQPAFVGSFIVVEDITYTHTQERIR